MNPILEALIADCSEPYTLPVGDEIIKKITSDTLVGIRCMELMLADYAEKAIRQMHPAERIALRKRILPPPVPRHHRANWQVKPGLNFGRPMIYGACGRCGQDCHYDGKPSAAKDVLWSHCSVGPSKIPEAIIAEYSSKFGSTS
jgi:hypothetical protein